MAIPFNPATDVPATVTTAEAEAYRLVLAVGENYIAKEVTLKIAGQDVQIPAFTYEQQFDTDGKLWGMVFMSFPLDVEALSNPDGLRPWEYCLSVATPASNAFPTKWK